MLACQGGLNFIIFSNYHNFWALFQFSAHLGPQHSTEGGVEQRIIQRETMLYLG